MLHEILKLKSKNNYHFADTVILIKYKFLITCSLYLVACKQNLVD